MHPPELVDDDRLSELIKSTKCLAATSVNILQISNDKTPEWFQNLNEEGLSKLVANPCKYPLRIIFLSVATGKWLFRDESVQASVACLQLLQERCGLSPLLLQKLLGVEQTEHLSIQGNAAFLRRHESGAKRSLEIHYSAHFAWGTGESLVQMNTDGENTTYFCVNCDDQVVARVRRLLDRGEPVASRSFLIDATIMDVALVSWAEVVKNLQAKLLEYEGKDLTSKHNRNILIADLHSIRTNWTVIMQDLSAMENTIQFLRKTYQRSSGLYLPLEPLDPETPKETEEGFTDTGYDVDDSLAYLESRCSIFRGWASNYLDRTNTRIQLIFHLSNQEDSQTNLKIAELTKKLAEKTQRDSASMITIAAVTMFFLPMTSVSSVISAIFFDYGAAPSENGSRLWWVFPVVVIPLTILVFATWAAWLRWRRGRDLREVLVLDGGRALKDRGAS